MPHEEKQNDSRMKNRCQSWDYSQPGTYMITITLENRNRPDLGKLERCRLLEEPSTFSKDLSTEALLQECKNVRVKLSPIGRFVYDEWNSLHKKYENIVTKGCKVMPDHFHGIIWVYKPLGYSVSEIIRAFKYQTSSYFKKITFSNRPLWEEGFVDSILGSENAIERAKEYMADNPRRFAIKKLSPDMFRVVDNISIEGLFPDQPTEKAEFSSIGNRFLLDRVEFFQVQCSRNDFLYSRKNGETYRKQKPLIETKQYLSQKCAMLEAGHKGAVIVSPCISDGEKALARIASEMGFPIITLCRTGFERLYKPSGELYDLCASGKLLMLAPIAWGVQYGKRTITREKAVILNRLVQLICKNKGSEIEYQRSQIKIDDTMVKLACTPP